MRRCPTQREGCDSVQPCAKAATVSSLASARPPSADQTDSGRGRLLCEKGEPRGAHARSPDDPSTKPLDETHRRDPSTRPLSETLRRDPSARPLDETPRRDPSPRPCDETPRRGLSARTLDETPRRPKTTPDFPATADDTRAAPRRTTDDLPKITRRPLGDFPLTPATPRRPPDDSPRTPLSFGILAVLQIQEF